MLRRFSVNFALFSIGLDAILIVANLALAIYSRPALNALPFARKIIDPIEFPWFFYIIFPLVWILIFLQLSLYDGRRNLKIFDEIVRLSAGSFLAAISLAGLLYLSYREISRLLFVTFVLGAFLSMIVWRLVARTTYLRHKVAPGRQRKVLIIGFTPAGRQVMDVILQRPELGYRIVGVLDDQADIIQIEGTPVGSVQETAAWIKVHDMDDVVIALPRSDHERINLLVADLHRLPVRVWLIPDYFQLALHKAVVEDFAGIPMLDLRAPAISDDQRMLKRAFELLLTAVLIIPTLLIMAVIAILIRISGPGGIIFRQKRVGENGRLFEMYKFRTMIPRADQISSLVEESDELGRMIYKKPGDPRITRVGAFLRRTSLDELPQIFNVLRGEMSLVGPRPELPELVARYEPWQWKRFTVPQGITGWWQVNGRSNKPMHLHTEDDLYYVQNYSIWLDIRILLMTVGVVFRGEGAF
jgi:exopolysaccharide biosynthesis polyprenyl glycosylphosphotransferase